MSGNLSESDVQRSTRPSGCTRDPWPWSAGLEPDITQPDGGLRDGRPSYGPPDRRETHKGTQASLRAPRRAFRVWCHDLEVRALAEADERVTSAGARVSSARSRLHPRQVLELPPLLSCGSARSQNQRRRLLPAHDDCLGFLGLPSVVLRRKGRPHPDQRTQAGCAGGRPRSNAPRRVSRPAG